jgi:tRNA G18 (ribose-2'-O)-methylase SpoU
LIRNSNFFGYEKVFYVGGKKHYDRRGTVGTHNYIDVTFIKTEEEFVKTIKDQGYTLISIENNVNYECSDLFQFMDNVNVKDIKPIFIFGEEQKGLSDYILDNSEHILTISGKGTVRSLNVGTASGIVLGYYSKFF